MLPAIQSVPRVGLSSVCVRVSASEFVLRQTKLLGRTSLVVVRVTSRPRSMVNLLPVVTAGLLAWKGSLGRAVLLRIPPSPFRPLSLPRLCWTADLSVPNVLYSLRMAVACRCVSRLKTRSNCLLVSTGNTFFRLTHTTDPDRCRWASIVPFFHHSKTLAKTN